ncbi:bifunctional (p)ppGpp synthetase/guanosine-3',5'-bis(diphosphate) 3'-pyrophosphohydrolase [Candidatus Woesebacteria bacterium]|nr:MAG: bifunctional (p)ppGpp synthetase/guanosine-3',5'-bis(diphosphate) 3'-pyrophosphohydrolase [Candidatus Woesebacteria bacterium]
MNEQIEKRFTDLTALVKTYNKFDVLKLTKTWEFAKIAHEEQKRKSGELFVLHPLEVAIILAQWKLDESTVLAGLLHDTIDDGAAKRDDLVNEFGQDIANLVDGVTKVSDYKLRGNKEVESIENLRKLILVMARDLRVVFVKIADRLHNMRTLEYLPIDKQKRVARETLNIYAPLAERLGMGEINGELNDLAFRYLYPTDYDKVEAKSKLVYKEAERQIRKMRSVILTHLSKENIKPTVIGREKRLYSLWKKLQREEINWDYSKIHDIVALRIIVDKPEECYLALGLVHKHYKPVPYLGISDYIAQPKPNGYQSIHTKVFGPGGRITEVQIRTHTMHKQAEFGAASHISYNEMKSKGVSDEFLETQGTSTKQINKLSWVKELVKWQKELTDSETYIEALKFDALMHRIFVFSPQGDVYDLPANSTPVDFAYAVHSDLGKYIKSIKVNGKIASLSHKLSNGDVVEITKTKNPQKPNKDWERFVKTIKARNKIRKELAKK